MTTLEGSAAAGSAAHSDNSTVAQRTAGAAKDAVQYEYRRVGEAEFQKLNDLYNANYRSGRPLKEAEWLYADNTNGAAVIFSAFDRSGALVGMRPMLRFKLWWQGEVREACEFADAVVHPDHQRRGIFGRLVQMTCDHAVQENCTLFSLPNENSRRAYLRKPLLHVLGESVTRGRPLSWLRYFAHQLRKRSTSSDAADTTVHDATPIKSGGLCLRPITRFESDFADVREELQQKIASFTLRSKEFLQWRYFGSPVRKYHVAVIEDEGRTRGYVAIRMVSGVANIVDFFVSPDPRIARGAFRMAAKWAKRMGAIGIHFSSAGNDVFEKAAGESGYWLKKRTRQLVIDRTTTRLLSERLGRDVTMQDVYFVMGDFDFI